MLQVCDDPVLLAMQLTLVELDRLSHIGPEEFIHYFLNMEKTLDDKAKPALGLNDSEDDDEEEGERSLVPYKQINFATDLKSNDFRTYLEQLQRTRELETSKEKQQKRRRIDYLLRTSTNIDAYILWFNRLSQFVTSEIVKNLNRKNRIKMIHYFIDCANACFELGNYNSSMAIIGNLHIHIQIKHFEIFFLNQKISSTKAGLNSFNISRLRKTVSEIVLPIELHSWN